MQNFTQLESKSNFTKLPNITQLESKIKLHKVAKQIKFHKVAKCHIIGIKNQTSQSCKILHNWNQKSNLTLDKITWIYQEIEVYHHRIKDQALESCDKNLNKKSNKKIL